MKTVLGLKNAKMTILLVVVCMIGAANVALADTIRGINMEFVTVGNPGNAADTGGTPGCGAVSYNYRIGKYEVTNAQWNTFIAAAGVPKGNPSTAYDQSALFTSIQQPTNNISWYEAAQFCNYLTSGDKSKGAYLFSGNNTNPGNFQGINRALAQTIYGTIYVIPTEDEWYKAAYHKNDGVTGNYWLYPTQSNDMPSNDLINPDPGNNANFYRGYNDYTVGYPDYLTAVGEFENSASAYGTFDQGGNVWEWNESLVYVRCRGVRGGGYNSVDGAGAGWTLASFDQAGRLPGDEGDHVGFRIVSIVPEPATLFFVGLGGLFLRQRRK